MKSLFKSKTKTPVDLVRQTRDLFVSLDLSGTEGKERRRDEKMMDLSKLIRELKQVLHGNCESEPVAEACAQFTSEFFRELAHMATVNRLKESIKKSILKSYPIRRHCRNCLRCINWLLLLVGVQLFDQSIGDTCKRASVFG